ncbi:TetR/AcrR family transcriptional regulator C-terminal domain-containing protein [Streptomyces sp. NPDC029041]|uniref:TetR/AcrR family transcriptional regulator C-terminal domain-containing protein n=1 Tax=Streptomyces sp. NPDC029041 TaxID=3155727 RepID=UPI0033C7D83E
MEGHQAQKFVDGPLVVGVLTVRGREDRAVGPDQEVGGQTDPAAGLVGRRHRSLAGLRWSESVLGVLTEAGFDGDRRVIALRGLLGYLIGAIQLEHLGPLSGDGTLALAELPPDAFPRMAETAHQARKVSADREFTGGLALLLRGLGG